jgi:hypothetical protein
VQADAAAIATKGVMILYNKCFVRTVCFAGADLTCFYVCGKSA